MKTKQDIYATVAKKLNISDREASCIVNTVIDTIIGFVKKGNDVQITGFGTFKIRQYKARKITSIDTGKVIKLPQHKSVYFKVGKYLNNAVRKKK